VNRREFLNFAWLVSIGFFTFATAGVTYLFPYHASRKVSLVGCLQLVQLAICQRLAPHLPIIRMLIVVKQY
jgi:hypothetical protein